MIIKFIWRWIKWDHNFLTLLVSGTQTQLPPSFLSEQVAAPALGSVLVAVASSGPPLFLVYSSSCLMHPDMQSTLKFMLFSPNSFSQHISQYYLPKQSFVDDTVVILPYTTVLNNIYISIKMLKMHVQIPTLPRQRVLIWSTLGYLKMTLT